MKSAAKRDNYCELQDIQSSNNLNANGGFGYSWNHVRLRVDKLTRKCNITNIVKMLVENWVCDYRCLKYTGSLNLISGVLPILDRLCRKLEHEPRIR